MLIVDYQSLELPYVSLDRSEDCYDWNAFRRTEIGRVGDCTRKGMGPGETGMTNSIWNMGYKCKSVAITIGNIVFCYFVIVCIIIMYQV